jgi:hypothetical protein
VPEAVRPEGGGRDARGRRGGAGNEDLSVKLQYAVFYLPPAASTTEQEDLNRFLRGHRIIQTWKEFVTTSGMPGWAILVEYMEDGKAGTAPQGKIDYKEILSEIDFAIFCRLRDVRKTLAEQHGLPVYAVFTNEQLAEIARKKPASTNELMKIDGIGQGKIEKFAAPKKRTICAASFPERIVHHALMNILDPVFDRYQIFDSYACRRGKGTQAAVLRSFASAKKYPYFLKMDVRKYFDSIDHTTLDELLHRRIKDHNVLENLEKIINSYSTTPGRGIPIGNLTSQYFANHYLAVFDHAVKERFGCQAYIRYMDDMVIFGRSRSDLNVVYESSRPFLSKSLKLDIKPKIVDRVKHGVPFLGFLVKPSGIFLLRKTKSRFKSSAGRIEYELRKGTINEESAADRVTAIAAHTALARARNFRYRVFHGGRPRATTG